MPHANVWKTTIATLFVAVITLGACTSDQVIDNTVGVAAGTTRVVTKGAVGAGRLAYRGGRSLVVDDE